MTRTRASHTRFWIVSIIENPEYKGKCPSRRGSPQIGNDRTFIFILILFADGFVLSYTLRGEEVAQHKTTSDFSWQDITGDPSNGAATLSSLVCNFAHLLRRIWAIYDHAIYDFNDYVYTMTTTEFNVAKYNFLPSDLVDAFQQIAGSNITPVLNRVLNTMDSANRTDLRYIATYQVQNYMLLAVSSIITASNVSCGRMAVQFFESDLFEQQSWLRCSVGRSVSQSVWANSCSV